MKIKTNSQIYMRKLVSIIAAIILTVFAAYKAYCQDFDIVINDFGITAKGSCQIPLEVRNKIQAAFETGKDWEGGQAFRVTSYITLGAGEDIQDDIVTYVSELKIEKDGRLVWDCAATLVTTEKDIRKIKAAFIKNVMASVCKPVESEYEIKL